MTTHEININWKLTEDVEVTSGVFYMDENRQQTYSLSNNAPYILNAANYGLLDTPLSTVTALTGIPLGFAPSMMAILGWPNDTLTPHVRAGDAPLGTTISGRWQGLSLIHI